MMTSWHGNAFHVWLATLVPSSFLHIKEIWWLQCTLLPSSRFRNTLNKPSHCCPEGWPRYETVTESMERRDNGFVAYTAPLPRVHLRQVGANICTNKEIWSEDNVTSFWRDHCCWAKFNPGSEDNKNAQNISGGVGLTNSLSALCFYWFSFQIGFRFIGNMILGTIQLYM